MKYLVRVGNLKHKIDFLEKQLVNIDEAINELEQVKLDLSWEGDAANTFSEVYDEYLFELKDMSNKILSYINFLLDYCKEYGNEYSNLRSRLRTMLREEGYHGNN